MRLIDADELKKAIKKELPQMSNWGETFIPLLIDNVPSVEPEKVLVANVTFDKDELARIVDERVIEPIKNGELVIKEERLQGKWIFKHNSSDIWCSVCDENFDEIPQKFKFCPNCGADMRKGDET